MREAGNCRDIGSFRFKGLTVSNIEIRIKTARIIIGDLRVIPYAITKLEAQLDR
jgi:hypothetical protein